MNGFAAAFRPQGLDRIDPILVILWLILVMVAVIWIAPFVFIVFTSLKANSMVMGSNAFAPPTSLEWGNYFGAWARGQFQHNRLQQRRHYDHQGAARPLHLRHGGLCLEPDSSARRAARFSFSSCLARCFHSR